MNPRLAAVPTYPQVALDAARARALTEGLPLYDLGTGDPLEPTPPFIRDALVAAVPEVSRYPSAFGSAALRTAAAESLRRTFGVRLDPERQVLATAGSKEAIFHVPLALLDATSPSSRRGVIFGDPGYPVYASGAVLAGGEPLPVRLDAETGWLLEPDAIPAADVARARILWLSYPNNPTGVVADRAYLDRVVRFAAAHDLVVCADECYAELGGAGRATSVLELATDGVLAFHSLSKRSGMTGYRSGFVAGDASLVAAYRKLRPLIGTGSPDFVQRAAVAAWSDDTHVAVRRATFEAKRAVFRAFFQEVGLHVVGDGALYLWAEVPRGETAEAYAARLLAQGVVVAPGSYFGAGEGFVRVALVPELGACKEATEAWRRAL